MVDIKDLEEDYQDILRSGELERPHKENTWKNIFMGMILAIVVLSLTLWSVAWLY